MVPDHDGEKDDPTKTSLERDAQRTAIRSRIADLALIEAHIEIAPGVSIRTVTAHADDLARAADLLELRQGERATESLEISTPEAVVVSSAAPLAAPTAAPIPTISKPEAARQRNMERWVESQARKAATATPAANVSAQVALRRRPSSWVSPSRIVQPLKPSSTL